MNSSNPFQPLSSLPGLYQSMTSQMPAFKPTPPIKSSPMGVPAKSPNTNVAAVSNAIPQKQTQPAPPTTPISTPAPQANPNPPTTNPNPVNQTFPGLVGSLANTGVNGTPQVDQANQNLLDFQKQYANYQNAVGTEPNPFGFETGVGQLAQNRYAQELPAYQQAVTNALASQSQRIGALGTAVGAAAPQQVSPGNFYVNPQTGQDVSGGSISPGIGGARQAQVAQGAASQTNLPKINAAAGYVNSFNTLLANSGLQQSDINVGNLINNLYASNTSNPAYPQLQASFNNAINFYAQVLGQDPNQLVTSLASTGRGSTVSALLANLDKEARDYNNQVQSASFGGGSNVSIQPPAAPARPAVGTSGVTPSGVQYTIIQ